MDRGKAEVVDNPIHSVPDRIRSWVGVGGFRALGYSLRFRGWVRIRLLLFLSIHQAWCGFVTQRNSIWIHGFIWEKLASLARSCECGGNDCILGYSYDLAMIAECLAAGMNAGSIVPW